MKNLKNLFLVIMLVSCFAFSASAQTAGSITLVHVDGLYAPDTIEVGKPITFHFRLQNNFGEAITGFSNGFRIYSPSEAIWDTADAAFTGAITPAMMDFGTFLSLRNVDGIGEDTIGFGGVSNFGTGIPDQFNDTVWSITIGPIAGSEHLKEICIDSSFYSPSNIWLWVLNSGNVIPDWGGPYCFTIFDATTLPQNSPPVLDSIGDRTVDENVNLNFTVTASDSDGTAPQLTSSALPTGALFTDNGDGTGFFDWTPDFTQAGTYFVTFYASDATDVDSEVVTITVNGVNAPPVIGAIGNKTVNEGDTLTFNVSSSDPDGETPFMTMSSPDLPPEATFQASLIAVGVYTFDWPTDFFDAGTYTAIFTANDGNGGIDEDTISITVSNVNQLPIFTIVPHDTTIAEGQTLVMTYGGYDTDSDSTSFEVFSLPLGYELVDNGDSTATLTWTPTFNDAGIYEPQLVIWGDISGVFVPVTFTVTEVNLPPQIDPLPDTLTINEGDTLSFFVNSTDFEDFCLNLQMTSPDLPPEAVFTINGECGEAGNFDWQTNFSDAGIYKANFTVTDDSGGVGTDSVIIIVNNVNRPPVLDSIGNKTVQENQLLSFNVSASDPDEDILAFSTSTLPPGADFFSSNGGWAFVWTPDFTQSGNYSVTFFVSDGLATDREVVSITVFNVNQQPVLEPINDTTINEGQSLVLSLSGFDPDGTQVFFDVIGEPVGSNLVDNGDGTATFSWTPTFSDAGIYDFVFFLYGVDKEGASDSIRIIVENFNRPPSFVNLPDTVVASEQDFVQFKVNATDPDEDCLFLSMTSPDLPESALFFYGEDCLYNGLFEWETTYDDAGIYQAIFAVEDEFLGQAEDTVIIIINNKNQPPRFDFNEGEGTNEGTNLNFLVIATDGDSTIPSISVLGSLPIGALFIDNRDGTGTFDWTPDFTQSREHSATFVATDDSLAADTMTVFIFINEAGDAVLTVKNATCVQCSPPQNFTDIIVTESNFTIEFNNQIDQSSLNGNINFASASGQTFDYFYDEYSKLLYVYPFSESEPFHPADTITVFLSSGIVDLSESPLDSNYSLTYFTGPVVFPGDADNNGIVDERDILSLGLYWNLTGPARDSSTNSLQFAPSPGHFQVLSEKWEPNVAAYADADGSGTVNADDICGVSFNFGLSIQTPQKNNGDMPASKQLDNSVMQQLYNALIECPNSAGKTHLVEFLEDAINSQSVILP
ncbi:MAG: tandem-95 repeat protein, partial [candidate division Zixibacteria bacterium]|nr:tandem-95 repeat protein [candidate division Zixibacteria bacterium]